MSYINNYLMFLDQDHIENSISCSIAGCFAKSLTGYVAYSIPNGIAHELTHGITPWVPTTATASATHVRQGSDHASVRLAA